SRIARTSHGLADCETLSMKKPPTGEPYAGKPPVRFGGRGGLNPSRPLSKDVACDAVILDAVRVPLRQGIPLGLLTKISVTIVSSEIPAPTALGCCAPDFGSPYIASIVRRMLTCVMPLPSGYTPGLTRAPAKIVTVRFRRSSKYSL